MTLRLVLFDLIGTLLDEDSDYEALDKAMEAVAARFGTVASPADLSGEFTLAFMEIVRSEEPDGDEPAEFMPFADTAREIFAGLMRHHGVPVEDEDKEWFWDTYLRVQKETWRPYPEVPEVIAALEKEGYLLGVVTDADRYLVEDALPVIGLDAAIDIRVSAEETGHVKPHPAVFQAALDRAGVKASEAVFVGDSYERDVLGALGAGIPHAVLVDRHDARTTRGPRINSLRPLMQQLTRLEA